MVKDLNTVALEGTKVSITIEETNNTNDLNTIASTATRLFNNYTKSVGADTIKIKNQLNKANDDAIKAVNDKSDSLKGELVTKHDLVKVELPKNIDTKINTLNISANTVQSTIVTMSNAISDNSLDTVVSDSVIAIKDANGMRVHTDVAIWDDILLPLPEGTMFAVNYMEGDISSSIGDNAPLGIETVGGYTGDGTFTNIDNSLCGQIIIGKGLWFGIGTENKIGMGLENTGIYTDNNYEFYLENDDKLEAWKFLSGAMRLTNTVALNYRDIQTYSRKNGVYIGFKSSSMYQEGNGAYMNLITRPLPQNTYKFNILHENILSTYDISDEYHKIKIIDGKFDILGLRFDVDTQYSHRTILNPQLEFNPFPTPFVKNKRLDTKIIYRTVEV